MAGKSEKLPKDVRVHRAHPSNISEDEWLQMQTLAIDAFTQSLPERPPEAVEQLFCKDDPDSFISARLDPNEWVRAGAFNPGQIYRHPCVTTAHQGDDLIGYLLSADNVSSRKSGTGGLIDRELKMRLRTTKRWAWLGEVAVRPDMQCRHVASVMVARALLDKPRRQPVSAYVWAEDTSALHTVASLGMEHPRADDLQPKQVFGDADPVVQIRFISTVGRILDGLFDNQDIHRAMPHGYGF